MLIISDPIYVAHQTGKGHPEQPARAKVVAAALEAAKLKTEQNTSTSRKATDEEILLCHTQTYLDLVRTETNHLEPTQVATLSTGDVQICSDSFDVALYAAGGVLTAIDGVMAGQSKTAFCIVRPPGHHACSGQGMGFCLFNNIAIGARYAQRRYGLERILIVDWDVHHGNGTQEIFYADPSVFYMSTHEKDLYPFTGASTETGTGAGKGTTLNVPIVPTPNAREEVLQAFKAGLVYKMKDFKPQLILISAGFDAHKDDPLGHFNLTDQDFATLTGQVKALAAEHCQGKIISVLEGGYHLQALASAAVAHVNELRSV